VWELISKMPSNVICPSGTGCTGMFTIENDGGMLYVMIATYGTTTTTTTYYYYYYYYYYFNN
jgi:hypothetical protein